MLYISSLNNRDDDNKENPNLEGDSDLAIIHTRTYKLRVEKPPDKIPHKLSNYQIIKKQKSIGK